MAAATDTELRASVARLVALVGEIRAGLAAGSFTPDNCPLAVEANEYGNMDHHELSQIVVGLGRWLWDCPGCGAHFEE